MRAGCRRILKWIGIGFFVLFCMIPLGIALFQEATGIVILPTTEPLPTSVALAVPSETPAATNILPSATNTALGTNFFLKLEFAPARARCSKQ